MDTHAAIEKYRSEAGEASAQKRGRNPVFPYVPVILHQDIRKRGETRQEQILKRAFITREEAVIFAQKVIDARVKHFEKQINSIGCRALREQYGLPRELV